MGKEKFTIEKAILVNRDMEEKECYFMLDDGIPMFEINRWLEYKGSRSILTARTYAYSLRRFLNFLDFKGKSYKEATKKDVMLFVDNILFLDDENVLNIESKISYNTASNYLTVIKEFYRYLEDFNSENSNITFFNKRKRNSKEIYLYGQIWDMDIKEMLNTKINRIKGTKEYIKWYTDEEIEAIEAIISRFYTLRDKAIFLLTLEGMRIDEVLSLTLDSYDEFEGTVIPNRTKGSKYRKVPIRERTKKALEDYLYSERSAVEAQMGLINNDMFVNLKEGKSQGKAVTYNNMLNIIKGAAKRAGLDNKKICTHSGRSTRVMELLRHQAKNPEDNITDEQIRLLMGWNSPESIKSYVNYKDERILIDIAKKINDGEVKSFEYEESSRE